MTPPVVPLSAPRTCEGCKGSCCYDWDVEVEVAEIPAVGIDLVEPAEESGGYNRMRRALGTSACIALDPETARCGIYSRRPAVCREFALGSWPCFKKAVGRGWKPDDKSTSSIAPAATPL